MASPGAPAGGGALRIVCLGYVVRWPLGGMAWSNLQYVLGLTRLGHEVWLLEDSGSEPLCYDPERDVTDGDAAFGLRWAADVMTRLGLPDRWAYHDRHAGGWRGPGAAGADAACRRADVVLNLAGRNPLLGALAGAPVRVFVDEDPAFTQVRHLHDAAARELASGHNVFLTFGEAIGRPDCRVPDDGLPWRPTRQPVVLDRLRPTPVPPGAAWTTVMKLDSYAAREHGGVRYGRKLESLEPLLDLPRRTTATLELAAGGPKAFKARLRAAGWRVVEPLAPTRDPFTYEDYIRASRGEFSVAKHGYVVSRSGWFSERTAAYLALGRPALVEDTGFAQWLPVGEGLLAFRTVDEAVAGLDELQRRPELHARAARAVAEAAFDARQLLPRLLDECVAVAGGLRR
jgi:hypothetical protein